MARNLVIMLLAACATTTTTADKPGSRGPRGTEHLAIARQQEALALQQARYPEHRHGSTSADVDMPVPWAGTWDAAADHERLARIHRSTAAQLQAEYDEACGSRSIAEVSVSPLQRHGVGGTPIEGGSVIFLSPDAGSPEQLLRDMRCHRAWMMLAPSEMDDCPLDLPGIAVTARGGTKAIEVTIKINDSSLVGELHRRTGIELEMAARRPARH